MRRRYGADEGIGEGQAAAMIPARRYIGPRLSRGYASHELTMHLRLAHPGEPGQQLKRASQEVAGPQPVHFSGDNVGGANHRVALVWRLRLLGALEQLCLRAPVSSQSETSPWFGNSGNETTRISGTMPCNALATLAAWLGPASSLSSRM